MKNVVLILQWVSDPGHEWLEIPEKLMPASVLEKVSEYSFYSHDLKLYFLEGDCDAAHFGKWAETQGIELQFRFREVKNFPRSRYARVGAV